ncbi:hypothetical protein C8Q74DRAFT_220770 [Fomes fomentarius]|nr:hypothetical protein C8Q74DRAFT_220770 [Fomes fomentarius]
MFTHIEKLRIVGGWWPASTLFTGTRQAVSPHIPSIHTLILEGCDASWASTLLESRRQSGHHLRAIHLRPDSIYELVSVGGHLQDMSAAQALVELHLDMSDRRHNDVIEGWDMHALLALCSSLERVTLTVSSQRYPFQDSTPVARVRIALGQLVSLLSTSPNSLPRLQFIAFTATEIPPMEWGTIRSLPEWSRFDEVVAGFAAVQHVDVSLHLEGCRNRPQEADGIEEWLRQVQNGMPRMVQGGLLKLQILGEEYQ